jgi:SpoVK/Ycf46/Vps4 family AAA+-type ATPase
MFQHNTTNYPERLGARIVNRPSRFDERICVGMPSDAARKMYLKVAAPDLKDDELDKWVKDTENFSIAHLRELVAACYCLDQEYKVTLKRLRSMTDKPRGGGDGFRKGNVGFSDDEPGKEG